MPNIDVKPRYETDNRHTVNKNVLTDTQFNIIKTIISISVSGGKINAETQVTIVALLFKPDSLPDKAQYFFLIYRR